MIKSISFAEATIICPKNDLESGTIVSIAQEHDADIRISQQDWGARLGKEPKSSLENLKKNVVIVEIPEPYIEKELREAGHEVFVIDHHKYEYEDRSHPLSSLEQFANLFNIELTARQKVIACNDRGAFWDAAINSTVSYDEIVEIQKEELREYKKYTPTDFDLSKEAYEKAVVFNSCKNVDDKYRFSLVVTTMSKVMYIAHLHQNPTREQFDHYRSTGQKPSLNSILILTVDETEENVVELNYFGQNKIDITELKDKYSLDDIVAWEGGTQRKCFWGGRKDKLCECNDFANAVLQEITCFDRPILKFSTTFLFPFKIEDKKGNIDTKKWQNIIFVFDKREVSPGLGIENKPYASYIYFHKYSRDILYQTKYEDNSLEPIKYYRYNLPQDTEFSIQTFEDKKISYPVKEIGIRRFFNDIGVLSIQVEQEIKSKRKEDFWKICRDRDLFADKHMTCEETLLFNEIARKTYISFAEQIHEKKIAKQVNILGTDMQHNFVPDQFKLEKNEPQLSLVISDLVGSFSKKFSSLLDDRMVVYSFSAFAGYEPRTASSLEMHKILLSRMIYVDCLGGSYFADPLFMQKKMEESLYRRWQFLGTIYGFTRYSSVYTGFGDYFAGTVYHHYNSMYYQLAVLSLFYRVFLIDFAKSVAETTKKLQNSQSRDDFLYLKEKFMFFSNIYWFEEVTNQDEGIEIFDMYKQSFLFRNMYQQIKEEVDRADEYMDICTRKKLEESNSRITKYGIPVGIAAVITGFFGMNFFTDENLLSFFGENHISVLGFLIGIVALLILCPVCHMFQKFFQKK